MDLAFTTGNSVAYKMPGQMAIVSWQISPVRGTGVTGKLQKIGHTKQAAPYPIREIRYIKRLTSHIKELYEKHYLYPVTRFHSAAAGTEQFAARTLINPNLKLER
jgi:hypothetical protein